MQKLLQILTVASLLAAITILGSIAPVAADEPEVIVEVIVFEDVDPCTGRTDLVTETFMLRLHEHDGRFVAIWDLSLESDSGYIGRGQNRLIGNGENLVGVVNLMVWNPDTGARFRLQNRIRWDLDDGPPQFSSPTLTCLRTGR